MLKLKLYQLIVFTFLLLGDTFSQSWIRINQLGYLPEDVKAAVLLSKYDFSPQTFYLHDVLTDKIVFTSNNILNRQRAL